MTVLVDFLTVVGALTVTSLLLLTALVWHVHRLRRKRDREVFAANVEMLTAMFDAIERHPAGKRAARPVPAPCGAVLGLSTDGWWELEFRAIAHVEQCPTCRVKVERKAA